MLALNEKWQHFEYSIQPRKTITSTCKNTPVILAHFNLSGPGSVSNIDGCAASPAVDYTPIFSGVGCRYIENDFRPMICSGTTITKYSGILTALQINRE